jgi:hypothetical protein
MARLEVGVYHEIPVGHDGVGPTPCQLAGRNGGMHFKLGDVILCSVRIVRTITTIP